MSDDLPEPIKLSEAQALLEQAIRQGPEIDNLVMAFSIKGQSQNRVIVGTTGHSATMWVLGALDHIRWNIFNAMTIHKFAKEQDVVMAQHMSDHLKKEGKLN